MNRYVGYGSLLLLISWLVLSYTAWLPAAWQFTVPFVDYGAWFQQATIAILVFFVSIQIWLLASTLWVVQRRQANMQSPPGPLTLSILGEFFWTALPLFLTIRLAVAGYKLWASL